MNNIRTLRINKGISQDGLAAELNISQQCVSMWETGERDPRTDKLPRLAKILGCSIDDLFKNITTTI